MNKRVIMSLFLCMLLLAAPAMAQVKKQEIVYARLSPRGETKGIDIVNDFEADAPEKVEDFGAYQGVENLTNLEDLAYGDEKVSFAMEKGRFRYQGNPKGLELPWHITLAYQLDGKDVQPENLSGAEGKLDMVLSVALNPALKAHAANLALQMTMTLDGDKCLNITSDKATIAAAGGTYSLAFVVLPGAEASFHISADVQNFSMADMQIAGVRMAMDADMYKQYAGDMLKGSPLEAAAGNIMDNMLGKPLPKPQSFADQRNGEVEAVQFVILMEGIAPKPVQKETTGVTEQEDQNVLTRLLSLFGG